MLIQYNENHLGLRKMPVTRLFRSSPAIPRERDGARSGQTQKHLSNGIGGLVLWKSLAATRTTVLGGEASCSLWKHRLGTLCKNLA